MNMFDALPREVRNQLNYGLYEWTPESITRIWNSSLGCAPEAMVNELRSWDIITAMRDRHVVWGMTDPRLVGYVRPEGTGSDEELVDWSD